MDPTNFPVPTGMEFNIHQPTIPSHGFNHPPYAEMIVNAIVSLKENNGSSRQAIAKYIDRAYTDLPPAHSHLLTQHLKLLRNNGHLVMNKHCYQLPGGSGGDGGVGGGGMLDMVSTVPLAPLTSVVTESVARKRGRPPKVKPGDQPINVPISVADAPVTTNATETANTSITDPAMLPKRKPGRPARLVSGGDLGGIKRNPVRARKIKSVSGSVIVPYLENEVRKGRGRPKKNVASSQANGVVNGGGVAAVKQKGRPRKVDLSKKPVANIGKRRPKQARRLWKNDVLRNGAPMWMVDYGFVKSKLDNVQSRIAQALSELRPYLIDPNMPSVVFALHELEDVSTMNLIGAPYQVARVNPENQV